ncbi:MAG TPA: ribonuclease III [Methanocorpusculum sp.]|nr:ribonuclease III [Methanocorpusculum sp.]
MKPISALCKTIGYTFKNDTYLVQALTRASYAKEQNLPYNMDSLAVLGDSVLDLVTIMDILNDGETKKSEITRRKIDEVNMTVLRKISEKIELPSYVLWGKGEQQMKIWTNGRVSAECFEALIGAVYLDGGIDASTTVIHNVKNDEMIF